MFRRRNMAAYKAWNLETSIHANFISSLLVYTYVHVVILRCDDETVCIFWVTPIVLKLSKTQQHQQLHNFARDNTIVAVCSFTCAK